MKNQDYILILNNNNNNILSDAITASDKIANYEYHQTNGFDGEIYNAFTSSIDVIIGILALIIQYRDAKANKVHQHEAANVNSGEEDDDETFITIIGPDGFEYRNVPIHRIADLLQIIKKYS